MKHIFLGMLAIILIGCSTPKKTSQREPDKIPTPALPEQKLDTIPVIKIGLNKPE